MPSELSPASSVTEPTHFVGVGASAGGLQALERLCKPLLTDTGMAFAVIQHLSPDFKSVMDELLARVTAMQIHRVEDGDPSLSNAYDSLLDRYMPAGVLLSDLRELVHVFGDASAYIQLRPGRPSKDVLEMFTPGIRAAASGAMYRAARDLKPVHYSGLKLTEAPDSPCVRLQVEPITGKDGELTHLMVTFEPVKEPVKTAQANPSEELSLHSISRERMNNLDSELRTTRENLQATIEELETSNEQLQATNEELVASNEEVQSTIEELHSVNEELYTVNAEYQKKITELTEMTDDLNHLFEHMDAGVLFLDRELTIRKFTKSIAPIFHLLPQDIGRSFGNFVHSLQRPTLLEDVKEAMQQHSTLEKEVKGSGGQQFVMRIQPHLPRGRVGGVVLELFDMTDVRKSRKQLRRQIDRLMAIFDRDDDLICVTDLEGRYLTMNEAYAKVLKLDRADVLKKTCHEVLPQNIADAAQAAETEVIRTGNEVPLKKIIDFGGDTSTYRGVKFPIREESGRIESIGPCSHP